MAEIRYTPRGTWGFECVLESDALSLTASRADGRDDATQELAPVEIAGDPSFLKNPALVASLGGYAAAELLHRRSRHKDKKKSLARERDRFRRDAAFIADLVRTPAKGASRTRWCSSCYTFAAHAPHKTALKTTVFLCQGCGSPTVPCTAPRCRHMAVHGGSSRPTPKYCAEHRHEVPDFERMEERLASFDEVADWLKFSKTNIPRVTKLVAGGAATGVVLIPLSLMAAPAVAGALGTYLSGGTLFGAAASSHGLAMLGGGSIAAGGLGMAGGTAVVTATGGALGATLGTVTTSAYVRSDKSFAIKKLQDGSGPAVLVASGFLSEGSDDWGAWRPMLQKAFPDRPIYRVHWGAKELRAFGAMVGMGSAKTGATMFVKEWGKKASKASAKILGPIGALFTAADVIANPWTVARARADMTGAALADILVRVEQGPFTLVGHSLGARVMANAASALGTREESILADVHLLGVAMSRKKDWRMLDASVQGSVFNYWSDRDKVLGNLYRAAEFGSTPVGLKGFKPLYPHMKNINLSRRVGSHSGYFELTPLVTKEN